MAAFHQIVRNGSGQTMHNSGVDWLRFSPIVVDADGDGSDELIIPSLVSDFGLNLHAHPVSRRTKQASPASSPFAPTSEQHASQGLIRAVADARAALNLLTARPRQRRRNPCRARLRRNTRDSNSPWPAAWMRVAHPNAGNRTSRTCSGSAPSLTSPGANRGGQEEEGLG